MGIVNRIKMESIMNKNDKNTKTEMNAADLKTVSGGQTFTLVRQSPVVVSPVVVSPIFAGDFRHW